MIRRAAPDGSYLLVAQHDHAVQILRELSAVEHDDWAPALGGYSLRRAETEADERFVVVAESQSRVGID